MKYHGRDIVIWFALQVLNKLLPYLTIVLGLHFAENVVIFISYASINVRILQTLHDIVGYQVGDLIS